MKNLLILFVFLSFVGFHTFSQETRSDWELINYDIFYHYIDVFPEALVLDVRYPEFYRKKRIINAISAPKKEILEKLMAEMDLEQPILIYGDYTSRCIAVADILIEADFQKVYILDGTFKGWRKKSYPIDKNKIK